MYKNSCTRRAVYLRLERERERERERDYNIESYVIFFLFVCLTNQTRY